MAKKAIEPWVKLAPKKRRTTKLTPQSKAKAKAAATEAGILAIEEGKAGRLTYGAKSKVFDVGKASRLTPPSSLPVRRGLYDIFRTKGYSRGAMESGQFERVGRECFLQALGWQPGPRQILALSVLTLANLNAYTEFRGRSQVQRTRP
jgi:hypothetical protein